MATKNGTVRWFNPERGFGFIAIDHTRTEVFVHCMDIHTGRQPELSKGDRVSFELDNKSDDRGPRAINVRVRVEGM